MHRRCSTSTPNTIRESVTIGRASRGTAVSTVCLIIASKEHSRFVHRLRVSFELFKYLHLENRMGSSQRKIRVSRSAGWSSAAEVSAFLSTRVISARRSVCRRLQAHLLLERLVYHCEHADTFMAVRPRIWQEQYGLMPSSTMSGFTPWQQTGGAVKLSPMRPRAATGVA